MQPKKCTMHELQPKNLISLWRGYPSCSDDEDGETLYGKRIVISTGSRSVIPPIEGLKEAGFLTNETIFEIQSMPNRMLVIGAGPIGLELAQSFARFGSEVTVVEFAPDLFGREDEDLVPYIQSVLEKELTLLLGTKVEKVEKLPSGEKKVTVMQGKIEKSIVVDEILVAAGRRPNTDRIGLDKTGIETERGHIVVKETLQTSVSHIYAIGDVLQAFPFTHAAGMEGKVVVGNAVFGLRKKISYDHVQRVTYTDPELFHLGLTEKEAREQYGDVIQVYKVTLDDVDRFVTDREMQGMIKVITDKKGKIIGAHAVGKGAGDWMQEIVMVLEFETSNRHLVYGEI